MALARKSFSMSWQIIKSSVKMSYDRIGMVLATSCLWFLGTLWPLLVVSALGQRVGGGWVLVAALLSLLSFGPATAAVHGIMAQIVRREDVAVRDFFVFWRQYLGEGLGLSVVLGILFSIVLFDLYFGVFATHWIFKMLWGLWFYFFIFLILVNNFTFPFLVNQKIGIFTALKRAVLVVLDNVVVALLVGLFIVVFTVLSAVSGAGLILLLGGVVALTQNIAYTEIMKRYDEPDVVNAESLETRE